MLTWKPAEEEPPEVLPRHWRPTANSHGVWGGKTGQRVDLSHGTALQSWVSGGLLTPAAVALCLPGHLLEEAGCLTWVLLLIRRPLRLTV